MHIIIYASIVLLCIILMLIWMIGSASPLGTPTGIDVGAILIACYEFAQPGSTACIDLYLDALLLAGQVYRLVWQAQLPAGVASSVLWEAWPTSRR